MGGVTTWTPENDAKLTRLRAAGFTTKQIATELEVSRGAVIGRAHRLGLDRRDNPVIVKRPKRHQRSWAEYTAERAEEARLRAEARPKPVSKPRVARAPKLVVAVEKPVIQAQPPGHPLLVLEPAVRRFVSEERQDNGCCWPIGEPGCAGFHYCNAPRDGHRVYCEAHRAIAYQRRVEAA